MPCLRCEEHPLASGAGGGVPPIDPKYPLVRLMGGYGPVLDPPEGFEHPLICGTCGCVYFPKGPQRRGVPGRAPGGSSR